MTRSFSVAIWLCAATLAIPPCFGQAGRGGISGTVIDNSGAVVAGAHVDLVNDATNTSQAMQTSSSGLYSFTALVPGTYRLTVTSQGFAKVVNNAIPIEVDRITTVDIKLSPGQLAQSIDVSESATPLLNTSDSTVGGLIDNKTIQSVPLNGRNLFLLVQLSPSVVAPNGSLNSTGQWNRPGIGVSAFRINGQPEGSLTYVLDGSPLTVDGYGTSSTSPALTPPLESSQEFRLQTNNTTASVDSHGSGVLSLVSKSGTNQLHGSAFYFNRPNALDANDPFTKAAQIEQGQPNTPPGFHRRQWGGSLGGPIRKDKLFFFGDYENTRAEGLSTATTTLPTDAERTGDVSSVPTVYNPFSLNATGARIPFAGNRIPTNMLDPVALAMQKLYPQPNRAGEGPYHNNNYFDAGLNPDNADKFDVRLDYYATAKHQIFGRYSFADTTFGTSDHFHNGADPGLYTNFTRGQNALLADNYAITPTTLVQLRYSFARHAETQPATGSAGGISLAELGFPASLASQQSVHALPNIGIGGMAGVGSGTWSTGFQYVAMYHDLSVSLDKVFGRHSLKVGFEFRKNLENIGQPIAPNGTYSFDATATSSTTLANNGYGYASFLLGMGNPFEGSQSFTQDAFLAEANPYYGAFVEDTFRATDRLTITAGLRWDVFGGRTERYNRLEYFDPDATYTVNGVNLKGGEVFSKGTPFTTNFRNFAPRLGVAYRVKDHLVFHSGGGIFYGPSAHGVATPFTNSDSFSSYTPWIATTYDQYGNSRMLNPLSNPFPNGLAVRSQGTLGLATNLGNTLQTVSRSQPEATAYNWNAGIQYEFSRGVLVSADYVGSRGLHQILGNGSSGPDLNQLSLEQIAQYNTQLGASVPNPYVNAITDPTAPFYGKSTIPMWLALASYPQFSNGSPNGGVSLNSMPVGDSVYHAGLLRVQKRFSSHFTTQASFTWGKVISNAGLGAYFYVLSNSGYQDWRNLKIERSVDAQDVSRSFSWATFYDLPVGSGRAVDLRSRWANWAIGGWTVNGVLSLNTGVPIVSGGSFPNQSLYMNQRPDLVCDPSKGAPRTQAQWFLPNCIAAPASPYVPGTMPRTLSGVRADGTHNIDFSLFKNFSLGEERNVQFRAECFNLFNSVQLGMPNAYWNSNDLSTFGQINSAASTPRQIQFGVRFSF